MLFSCCACKVFVSCIVTNYLHTVYTGTAYQTDIHRDIFTMIVEHDLIIGLNNHPDNSIDNISGKKHLMDTIRHHINVIDVQDNHQYHTFGSKLIIFSLVTRVMTHCQTCQHVLPFSKSKQNNKI